MKYTDNQEEVTLDQLKEYLKDQGNYNEETFSQNVDIFQQLIDDLIQMIQSKPMNNMGYQPKNYIRLGQLKKLEFYPIIQKRGLRVKNQQSILFKKSKEYKQTCLHYEFEGMTSENVEQSKDVVNKTYKFHTFEINEEDLNYIEDQMKKIEQTINALLL